MAYADCLGSSIGWILCTAYKAQTKIQISFSFCRWM
jgi:hypothetical protein